MIQLNFSLSCEGHMDPHEEEAPRYWQDCFGAVAARMIRGGGESVSVNIVRSQDIGYLGKEHGELSKNLSEVKNAERKVMKRFGLLLNKLTDVWIHIGPATIECISHT